MTTTELDDTHDAAQQSWVSSANHPAADFPLQNLPFGRFRLRGSSDWRLGVAIGDSILDLRSALGRGLALHRALEQDDLTAFMALGAQERRQARQVLFEALREGSEHADALREALLPQAAVEMGLPCTIRGYTDFFTGIHHAREAGKFSRPDAPLTPNYKWVPIAYHGRASSIVVSGTPVHRPFGQVPSGDGQVEYVPTRRLDYELEVGVLVSQGSELGRPVRMDQANQHWFGLVLLNDWSARDVQRWESQPLGPFLSKNFASSLSPWVVTQEALAPFRVPAVARPSPDPQPLAYLASEQDASSGGIALTLEAWLQTRDMSAPHRLMRSNFAESAYWTVAQMIAHHTSNGCNLLPGDLLGTGTQSGPGPSDGGCLLELTSEGTQPIELPGGVRRTFLEDGDRVELRGYCEKPGFRRISLGACSAEILAPPA